MLAPIGMGLLLLGIGAYATGTALSSAEKAVEGWAVTQAEMLTSAIVMRQIRIDKLKWRGSGPSDDPDRFRPVWDLDVRYQYRVGDRDYHGTVLSNIIHYRNEDARRHPPDPELTALSLRFAPGNKVEVLYDPAQPRNAVLLAGRLPLAGWLRGGGLAGAFMGALCLCFTVWHRMGKQA